eukprot:scaffold84258_cov63-Phaeocystis_antarctica.AAC.2
MTAASTNGSSEAFPRGAISHRARFVASSFSDLSELAIYFYCLLMALFGSIKERVAGGVCAGWR